MSNYEYLLVTESKTAHRERSLTDLMNVSDELQIQVSAVPKDDC